MQPTIELIVRTFLTICGVSTSFIDFMYVKRNHFERENLEKLIFEDLGSNEI